MTTDFSKMTTADILRANEWKDKYLDEESKDALNTLVFECMLKTGVSYRDAFALAFEIGRMDALGKIPAISVTLKKKGDNSANYAHLKKEVIV